jgi:hypothetical protein
VDLEDPMVLPFAAVREVPEGAAAKKAKIVKVEAAGIVRRRWTFPLLGSGYSGPVTVHRAKVGGHVLEVLDVDEDGDLAGAADHVRWAGGAFHPHPPSRRLASPDGIVTYRLERQGAGWSVAVTPEAKPADASAMEWAGLLAVGEFRNRVGLAPLSLDRARCRGCAKHAEYIRLNPADGFGHHEIEGRPGYSPEGLEAARLGVMERTAHPALAVDRLTRMMLHRPPFLGRADEPLGVGTVGVHTGPWQDAADTGFTVLWAARPLSSTEFPIVVPAPGARDVPREILQEMPDPEKHPIFYKTPRGYPVSVSFLSDTRRIVALRLFALDQREPRPIEAFVFTPESPVHSAFAHNYATAFLTAKSPLAGNTTYAVEATFEGAEPRVLCWTFQTTRD